MAKNEFIYERKGKKGLTLQVKVPYGSSSDRRFFSQSVRAYEYPSKAVAYEAARMIRDQAIVDINNNRDFHLTPTVSQLYESYWEMSSLSLNTRQQYQSVYEAVAGPLSASRIDAVNVSDIQRLIADYAESHSEQMIKKARHVWHVIYLSAQMQGINIADKTVMLMPTPSRKPVKTNKAPTVISFDDFVLFTQELLNFPYQSAEKARRARDVWYLLWIMYYTGCRPAEVLALNAGDIDLDARLLRVEKSVGSTKKARRQIVKTKRPASYRRLPIPDGLVPILQELLSTSVTSPLLCAADGLPYPILEITNHISDIKRQSGIQFNSYQLRHKYSDDLFDAKVNPVVIRDLMGHSSSTMSLEYAKATAAQMSDAVKTLQQERG